MGRFGLKFVLLLSLLLNLGVIGTVAYRAFQDGHWPAVFGAGRSETDLPDYLKLNPEQRRQWRDLEAGFLGELNAEWGEIRSHRETMIREIFSAKPDRSRIETERAVIAQLQVNQQQRIIEQLLKERAILDSAQQRELVELLLRQAPTATMEERLHGK